MANFEFPTLRSLRGSNKRVICRSHSLWVEYDEFRAGRRTHVPWVGEFWFYCKNVSFWSCQIIITFDHNIISIVVPLDFQYVYTPRNSQLRFGCVKTCQSEITISCKNQVGFKHFCCFYMINKQKYVVVFTRCGSSMGHFELPIIWFLQGFRVCSFDTFNNFVFALNLNRT